MKSRSKQIFNEAMKIIAEARETATKKADPTLELAIILSYTLGARWADKNPYMIPVAESLPVCDIPYDEETNIKTSLPVAVLLSDGTYHIATLNQDYDEQADEPMGDPYWFDENRLDDGDWLRGKVTHWMPLPKLVEEGKGCEKH